MLHEFVAVNRAEIIRRCRAKVITRSAPPPTEAEIDHGVPVFLDQLADALRLSLVSSPEMCENAREHGHDLLLQGFTVSQVVHDYGDVCQAITELASETNAPISTDDFRMLNRCLDDAIAVAVTEYGRERDQFTIDEEAARGSERLGFLAHELRNLVNTATVAFEVLKKGNVGLAGSTGTVLHRTLLGLRTLVGRSLGEVRLTQGVQNRVRFLVSGFIDDLVPVATEAGKRFVGRVIGFGTSMIAAEQAGTAGYRFVDDAERLAAERLAAEALLVYGDFYDGLEHPDRVFTVEVPTEHGVSEYTLSTFGRATDEASPETTDGSAR